METVVSLGSVNVDLVARLEPSTLGELTGRYDWFPDPDETVAVDSIPDEIDELVDVVHLGGKGANQAVAAAKAGGDSTLLGRVGHDQEEFSVAASLADRGVDTTHLEEIDVETGKAYVFLEPNGAARIAILHGANGAVDMPYVNRHRDAISAAALLLQNEIPIETMVTLARSLETVENRPIVVFDPAPVEDAAELLACPTIDIVTPNVYEYERLASKLKNFHGVVIRKRGAKPLIVEPPDAEPFRVEPSAVTPVDTTGAGDVFAGYLAARLALGDSLRPAVELAAAAASYSTTQEGAQRAIPSVSVVRDLLSS